ncbi:YifB family Mg chelatase-like AAA ATPase [Paludisphaera borealis]|nr:YifB family Mg chelatase-like AAA ATPase [Paludisphaera borealis]
MLVRVQAARCSDPVAPVSGRLRAAGGRPGDDPDAAGLVGWPLPRRREREAVGRASPGGSAPADLKKDASGFDLPIALGMLAASGQIALDRPGNFAVIGELALTGETRPVKGILSMALQASTENRDGVLVPRENAAEAAVVEGVNVYPVGSLAEAVGFLSGQLDMDPEAVDLDEIFARDSHTDEDFVDVKGQDYAKRALLIAASGNHNLLMIGPPGTGKTLLAKRLPTILPPLTPSESLETTRIYSAMGRLSAGQALMAVRPFCTPHHSVSDAGLVGGGNPPQPGQISMAHKGVLFLDEMPEFNRKTLEVLRQPLEEGKVTISRAMNTATFPAEFILVAAMNPCPCGYRSDPRRSCSCSPPQIEKYLSRISGPLLDRIDLHVEVPSVPFAQLAEMPPGVTSAEIRAQVLEARSRQAHRFGKDGPQVNGRMTPRQIRKHCKLKPEAMSILKAAMEELGLSARAYDKVLRVARTIADLEAADEIKPQHIAEAVGYRSLDRSVWV